MIENWVFLLIVTEFFCTFAPVLYEDFSLKEILTALGYHLLQYILWKEMNLCCL